MKAYREGYFFRAQCRSILQVNYIDIIKLQKQK